MSNDLTKLIRRIKNQRRRRGGSNTRRLRSRRLPPTKLALVQHKGQQMVPQSVGYIETDFREYATNKFIAEKLQDRIDTHCDEIQFEVIKNIHTVLLDILQDLAPKQKFITVASSPSRFQLIGDTVIMSSRTTSNSTFVEGLGDLELYQQVLTKLKSVYDEITVSIEWMISGDQSSITIPLFAPVGITNSSYPFIEEGVDAFVNDFNSAQENILLLIGPAGTGKSNFIKYVVAQSKKSALVTYDPELMKKDGIFASFIEGDYGSLIMEDADSFLGARRDGNEYMAKFLNVGDGVVSMRGKKLIFSTNLPSIADVDPALLRKGRCYSVLEFRAHTYEESVTFCKDHNITTWAPEPGQSYTLADLYNTKNRQSRAVKRTNKVGFL